MAIDTKSKRLSIANVSMPFRGVVTEPDGTIDWGDRLAIGYLYARSLGDVVTIDCIRVSQMWIDTAEATCLAAAGEADADIDVPNGQMTIEVF